MAADERRPSLRVICLSLGLFLGASTPLFAEEGGSRPLSNEEKKVIGQRLAPTVNFSRDLVLEDGGTVMVVRKALIDARLVKGGPEDYEAVVSGGKAPKGVVIQQRADEVTFSPAGKKVEVSFRYAIHAEPSAKGAGNAKLAIKLIERTGLSPRTILSEQLEHKIKLVPQKATEADLAADFFGYRLYRGLAEPRMRELVKRGLEGLSLRDNSAFPLLDRFDGATAASLYEMDRWRRRVWVAVRHLQAAAKGGPPPIAGLAKKYLAKLDASDAELGDLPVIALAPSSGAAETADAKDAGKDKDKDKDKDAGKPKEPEKTSKATEGKGGVVTLAPLETDSTQKKEPDPSFAPTRERTTPVTPVKPAQPTTPVEQAELEARADVALRSRYSTLPTYPRALTLDDPNVGFSVGLRLSYASITVTEKAQSPAVFAHGQVAFADDFGAEVTIPVSYLVLNVRRAEPLLTMGNPLLALKYRMHLPVIGKRSPVLTLRARWGIPINPERLIPPTDIDAGQFTVPAHFADTYAFMLEKHDFGLGASAAYVAGIFHASVQAYADYFVAVPPGNELAANQGLSFLALAYGASIGARPLGDRLGFYVEARGTTLLAGPRRSELFTYIGARGRITELTEAALHLALPIGSVGDVGSIQVGADFRFAYDLESVIDRGSQATRETKIEGSRPLGDPLD